MDSLKFPSLVLFLWCTISAYTLPNSKQNFTGSKHFKVLEKCDLIKTFHRYCSYNYFNT